MGSFARRISAAGLGVLIAHCLIGKDVCAQGSGGFGRQEVQRITAQSRGLQNTIQQLNSADARRGTAQRDLASVTMRTGVSLKNANSSPTRSRAASFSSARPGRTSKPFSSVNTRPPTVSPYLGLFQENLDFDTVNYNTIVEPLQRQRDIGRALQRQRQESQRLQQNQDRQQAEMNLRLQQLSARPAFNPQGAINIPQTGHPTVFGNRLNYYPQ